MKQKLLAAVALVGFSSLSIAEAAPSRRATIRAAQELSSDAYEMSSYARMRGYTNTAQHLRLIARAADRVEQAARRNDFLGAQHAMNAIEDTYINMRQFVNNILFLVDRIRIKRVMRAGINDLGFVLFESGWVAVKSVTSGNGGVVVSEEQQLDSRHYGVIDENGGFSDDSDEDFSDSSSISIGGFRD